MIARGTEAEVTVIALVGERGREVREFIEDDLGPEGLARSVVIVSTSDQPAMARIRAAYTATRIAEAFRDEGAHAILMMDSLTRVAMAQREIGLSAGEPPATRGYPPSTFSLLAGLLERAGTDRGGSITGIYTVLVDGDDHNEPIADTVRSILDGHVVLDRALALSGHHPAIDVLGSVSRVVGKITAPGQRAHAATLRAVLAARRRANDLIDNRRVPAGCRRPHRRRDRPRTGDLRFPHPVARRDERDRRIVASTRRARLRFRRSLMTRSFSLAGLLRVREIQERAAAQRLSRAVLDARHTEARDRSLRAHLSGAGSEAVDVRSLAALAAARVAGRTLLSDLTMLAELQEQTVDQARAEHSEARRAMPRTRPSRPGARRAGAGGRAARRTGGARRDRIAHRHGGAVMTALGIVDMLDPRASRPSGAAPSRGATPGAAAFADVIQDAARAQLADDAPTDGVVDEGVSSARRREPRRRMRPPNPLIRLFR